MADTYPNGYATQRVTLDGLRAIHEPRMHPEFARRLFAWIESQHGLVGIGGGWRAGGQQPNKPGFAPEGQSFHQSQMFISGVVAYSAVDLVCTAPGRVHRAPTWSESVNAPTYGLHTFIKSPTPEPWHMQCVEMRGYGSWVLAGRPDPAANFPLPGTTPPPAARPIMYPLAHRIEGVNLGANVQNLIRLGVPTGSIGAQVRVSLAASPAAPGFIAVWSPLQFWKGTAAANYQPGQIDGGTQYTGVNGAGECFVMASTDCVVNIDVQGYV